MTHPLVDRLLGLVRIVSCTLNLNFSVLVLTSKYPVHATHKIELVLCELVVPTAL